MAEIGEGQFQQGAFGSPFDRQPLAPPVSPEKFPEWRTRGGRIWMGTVLPFLIGIVGATAIAGAICALIGRDEGVGVGPVVFLFLLAALVEWLAWKVAGTVWSIRLSPADYIVCTAAARTWKLGPGEVLAVRGNAYGLLLVVVTPTDKIWLWNLMDRRLELLTAIRRSNPRADFDGYVCPPRHRGR